MRECQPCRPASNCIASADRVSPYEEGRETEECEITLSAFSSGRVFLTHLKTNTMSASKHGEGQCGEGEGTAADWLVTDVAISNMAAADRVTAFIVNVKEVCNM